MRIKHLIITTLFGILSIQIQAQSNTVSPYSIRGFGEQEQFNQAYSRSLGGASNGLRSGRSISYENPASLGALRNVNFDFGFRGDYYRVYSQTAEKNGLSGNFNYFSLSFPAYRIKNFKQHQDTAKNKTASKKKLITEYTNIWMSSFGFTPYSSINASYNKTIDSTYGEIYNAYARQGGLNRLFWMNAVNITRNTSLGLGINYLFGRSKAYDGYYMIDTGNVRATIVENNIGFSGFKFDLGFQSEHTWNLKINVREKKNQEIKKSLKEVPLRLVYGATASNGATLNYNIFHQIQNRSNYLSTAAIDTVSYEESRKGKTYIPASFSGGFSLTLNKTWMICADYKTELWGNVKKTLYTDSFSNRKQFNIGLAYRPDPDMESGLRTRSMPWEYRLGFRSLNTGYNFKDNLGNIRPLKEYGISFGIGIPKVSYVWVEESRRVEVKSLINITGEYIHRGDTLNGMIAEDLYRITLGFTLGDIWFTKRKIY